MKLGQCVVTNFGSYSSLSFDYSAQGLTLIHGPTGAGKSTLQDAAAWCLYGVTAKGGGVDDVRSWSDPTAYTAGYIQADDIEIYRFRGKGKNDLYWVENGKETRGKDIPDTQALLERRLGVPADLYLLGAYFHEFSLSGAFFTAKAKDRRQVFEQVANLALPTRISEKATARRKEIKGVVNGLTADLADVKGGIRQAQTFIRQVSANVIAWKNTQAATIQNLKTCSESFEADKARKIADLRASQEKIHAQLSAYTPGNLADLQSQYDSLANVRCGECGAPTAHAQREELMHSIRTEERLRALRTQYQRDYANLEKRYQEIEASTNQNLGRIAEEKDRVNPYSNQAEKLGDELFALEDKHAILEEALAIKTAEFDALVTISDLADSLRGELVGKSVGAIQELTNQRLEAYFDAEVRVTFELSGSDNLEVSLFKSGHACKYAQLSKGQRGLLKLCFATALMEVSANNAGVHFDSVFLDEALDGLDGELKVKAYGLLEELSLSHDSVFVIDHSEELKQLFTKKYQVTLVGDESVISAV